MKKWNVMKICVALLALLSSCVGLFYSNGGSSYIVTNMYGDAVELFGDGIYAHDSVLKASCTRGADISTILVCIGLIICVFLKKKARKWYYIEAGLLATLLYSTSCLIMGNTFNRMFLVYLIQFSLAFFTFLYTVIELFKGNDFQSLQSKQLKGTALFLMIGGSSVLAWMMFILPAVISGNPMENIQVYTTEPTYVFDLGIIMPFAWICGIQLWKKKINGYKMAPIILVPIIGVGMCVICQTLVQAKMGITLNIIQLLFLVGVFVVLGFFAILLLHRLLKHVES